MMSTMPALSPAKYSEVVRSAGQRQLAEAGAGFALPTKLTQDYPSEQPSKSKSIQTRRAITRASSLVDVATLHSAIKCGAEWNCYRRESI